MDNFWNCEPVRELTKEEHEILSKIEKRIEKPGENDKCFIHPAYVYTRQNCEKKHTNVRRFVFDIIHKLFHFRAKFLVLLSSFCCG